MSVVVSFVVGLMLVGALPAVATVGLSPMTVFLAPLIGGVTAAIAVEFEVGLGGTMLTWFVVLAVVLNLLSAAMLFRAGKWPRWWGGWWSMLLLGVLCLALAIPLTGLRSQEIGYDAAVIWTTHALLLSNGHHTLVTGLQSPTYGYSNPDYPPLVPAVSALGFALAGHDVLLMEPQLTALLNAAAIGALATGIASVLMHPTRTHKVLSVCAGALICLAAFGIGSDYGIDGYTDLLWSAAASAAVLWGLVLPRTRTSVMAAWWCCLVASLTKNEGLVTALVIIVLIALRYTSFWKAQFGLSWQRVSATLLFLLPAIPGVVWAIQMRSLGVENSFFGQSQTESLTLRTNATLAGSAHQLLLLPVAIVIAAIGWTWFRGARRQLSLGHPGWLAAAWLAGTFFILATYIFGSLEIHWWLSNSVDRTMIYARLLLMVDIVVWALVVLQVLLTPPPRAPSHAVTAQSELSTV